MEGSGGQLKGGGGGQLLQQRYLPNAWSRNTNTAPVMTETEGQEKTEEKSCSCVRLSSSLATNWYIKTKQRVRTWSSHSAWTQPNQPCLCPPPIQLMGLILASVSLKAECICPVATPKGRKGNTSKPAAQLQADFKEILGDCAPLRCPSPVTAKVTRVTLTAVLFMLLAFLLLKLFSSLLFDPHLLTTNTRRDDKTHAWTHTHTDTHQQHKWSNLSNLCVQTHGCNKNIIISISGLKYLLYSILSTCSSRYFNSYITVAFKANFYAKYLKFQM